MSGNSSAQGVRATRLLGKFWTLANVLSMARILLVVPITYLILTDGPISWIFALVVLVLVTDWFDGRIARWSRTVSEWGKVLDPLADKIAAAAIVLALVIRQVLPLWFLGLIVARDAIIVVGGIFLTRKSGKVTMSMFSGKVAVTALAITVLAALLRADEPILQICVWITSALLVFSFLLYAGRFVRYMRDGSKSAEPGPMSHEAGGAG